MAASDTKEAAAQAAASMDERLARRKIDALKRGIHRIGEEQTMPFSVHVVGLGRAGANVVAQVLKDAPDDFLADDSSRFTALAIDIGDQDLGAVQEAAGRFPADKAQVETLALEVPSRKDLFASLRRYREFLKLEFPRYYWNPNYEPWLPSNTTLPEAGAPVSRSIAKAIYGRAYYDGDRAMEAALRRFAASVDATSAQSVVCVVFGLGGGTGSGMMVDLTRHLSNVCFGRRVLVVGIGIAPCEGDSEAHRGSHLFPVLNELDCMGDNAKNEGVITVWGDLYRNPFTGGFMTVPQEHIWQATGDLNATHDRVNRELASFMTRGRGADLWETLRLLNWVGAPPTQHAAARTQYGSKWAHVLSFADVGGGAEEVKDLPARLGIRDSYRPEFIEVRAKDPKDENVGAMAKALGAAFSTVAEPEVAEAADASAESVQFILPCVSKSDLDLFFASREVYDTLDWEGKLEQHSWLVDLGVMLCEPAIRFDGMAGECLWGCACWVVVPYEEIRGPEDTSRAAAAE